MKRQQHWGKTDQTKAIGKEEIHEVGGGGILSVREFCFPTKWKAKIDQVFPAVLFVLFVLFLLLLAY